MCDKRLVAISRTLCNVSSELSDKDISVSELNGLYHEVLFVHSASIYLMYSLSGSEYETAKSLYHIANSFLLGILARLKLKERYTNEEDNIHIKN